MLYRAAFQYSGNRFDAEDFVQETFLAAYKHRYQLKDRRHIKSWLFVILRNHFRKRFQRRKTEAEKAYDDAIDYADALSAFSNCEDVHHALERRSTADNVQRCLQTLPEHYQTALILYYLEEFSYQEIADILNIPLGTVMSRLSRGKGRLKSALLRETFRRLHHQPGCDWRLCPCQPYSR
jgi:RNA polymerase sigma-70 factor (ECF subfamily)